MRVASLPHFGHRRNSRQKRHTLFARNSHSIDRERPGGVQSAEPEPPGAILVRSPRSKAVYDASAVRTAQHSVTERAAAPIVRTNTKPVPRREPRTAAANRPDVSCVTPPCRPTEINDAKIKKSSRDSTTVGRR